MKGKYQLAAPSLCLLTSFGLLLILPSLDDMSYKMFGKAFLFFETLGKLILILLYLLIPAVLLCSICGFVKLLRDFSPKKIAVVLLLAHILGMLMSVFLIVELIGFTRIGSLNH